MTQDSLKQLLARNAFEKLTRNPHGFDRVDQILAAIDNVHTVLETTDDHASIIGDYATTKKDAMGLVREGTSQAFFVLGRRLVDNFGYEDFHSREDFKGRVRDIHACVVHSRRPLAHFMPESRLTDKQTALVLHRLAKLARKRLPKLASTTTHKGYL